MARAYGVWGRLKQIREELVKYRYAELRRGAKRRKLEFALTLDEYRQVTAGHCAYCGGDLPFSGYGLDRKDSSRGYTLDNVVPCCRACNRIKTDILDAQTMSGIKGQLAARRLHALLRLYPLAPPVAVRRRRPRWQHPKPRCEGRSWIIRLRVDGYKPDGSIKRKHLSIHLGSTDEMDFAQAVLAAEKYIQSVNAGSSEAEIVTLGQPQSVRAPTRGTEDTKMAKGRFEVDIAGQFSPVEEAILEYLYEHPGEVIGTTSLIGIIKADPNTPQNEQRAYEETQRAIETLVAKKLAKGKRAAPSGRVVFDNLRLTPQGEVAAIKGRKREKKIVAEIGDVE